MDGVLEQGDTARLQERLLYLAWRRFRIHHQVAEDVVQAAILTFLQVRHRYPETQDHPKILVGILLNKCREHIGTQVRATKAMRGLRDAVEDAPSTVPAAARTSPSSEDGVLGDIVHREEVQLILQALAELRTPAREMLRLILEDGLSRSELIERYGLNKNTLDSRLHTYRKELRGILRRYGFEI